MYSIITVQFRCINKLTLYMYNIHQGEEKLKDLPHAYTQVWHDEGKWR